MRCNTYNLLSDWLRPWQPLASQWALVSVWLLLILVMGEWLRCLPAFLDDKPAKPSGTAFHGKKPSVPPPVSKKPTKPADPKLMAQTDDQKVQESQKSKTDTCVAAATQTALFFLSALLNVCSGGHFKNTYELLNLRALKFSPAKKMHVFQCMSKIFCVEFQMYPLKFHTKYLTHTLKDMIFIQHWNFKSSWI